MSTVYFVYLLKILTCSLLTVFRTFPMSDKYVVRVSYVE